jgi:hypothetical protein
MVDLGQRIKELENKVKNISILLNRTNQKVKQLENENKLDREQIRNKGQELEE